MRRANLFNKNSIFFYTSTLLASLIINGCHDTADLATIKFARFYNELPLDCEQEIIINDISWKLAQLQFYISEVAVKDAENKWLDAKFIPSDIATQDVALLGGVCGQSQQWQMQLASPINQTEIRGLKFSLGIPQHLNHLNPLSQPSPLNQSDMFWTWQLGHKFARVELSSDNNEWIFHLGSTGCQSASPVRPPQEPCLNPNRPKITLDDFVVSNTIAFDLAYLIQDIDLTRENNCQSAQNNDLCEQLFPRVGINHSQNIFHLK